MRGSIVLCYGHWTLTLDKGKWVTALSNLSTIVKVGKHCQGDKHWGVRHYLSIYRVQVACPDL